MSNLPIPAQDCVDAQREMFRLAAKQQGLTIAVIARRSPLSPSTLKGWATGTTMPAWALGALGDAGVADHLLSLVLEPYGKHVGSDETDAGDIDQLAREAAHYVADKLDAEADGELTPSEEGRLRERARVITGVARKASRA